MSKEYFLPRTDLEKEIWLKNFAGKLSLYADKYFIHPDEIIDMQQSAAYFSYWLDYRLRLEESLHKAVQYKNELINGASSNAQISVIPASTEMKPLPATVLPGIFKRATSIANVIKSKVVYTIADGNDLGIEGTLKTIDHQTMKPKLKLVFAAGGRPYIKWQKKRMDGIEIYVDRNRGSWELLAFDTNPNYMDVAALPEAGASAVWKYKAIYRLDDGQVGLWSDIVSITVTGF